MTDLGSFLEAIEADPADDVRWLVFADWLEEQGNRLSDRLRKTVEAGTWDQFCQSFLGRMRPRQVQLFVCECLLHVLPLFEEKYPEEQQPRLYLETLMRFASGRGVREARLALDVLYQRVVIDHSRDPSQFISALRVLANIRDCEKRFATQFHTCVKIAAQAAFGPGFDETKSWESPRWRMLAASEYRWQASRILRYHLA